MTTYCEKCISDKQLDAFKRRPRDYSVVLIVDPVLDYEFAERLIDMAVDTIPPAFRKVKFAVFPVVPCRSAKVPTAMYRECPYIIRPEEVWSKGALPVLCGKTIQKIALGNAPNQKSAAGHIVKKDDYMVGLLPGIQDIHDADIEDRDDWFDIFAKGLRDILKEVYRAETD